MANENIKVLIDEKTLAKRIAEIGAQITKEHAGREVILVPVLKGSFMFAADLARAIDLPTNIEFLGLQSYAGTKSTGVVQITSDLTRSVADKDVIIIEDIVDTGLTMTYLLENLQTRKPRSLKIASLLHKPARSKVHVDIDYLGFTIEDVFVIGYGLDYDGRYRNLPYVGVLEL